MKKLLTILFALMLTIVACVSCGGNGESKTDSTTASNAGGEKIKVGLIALHDDKSTYDKNFIDAFKAACEVKGVTPVIQTGIDEKAICQETAENLADEGCKLIFADSFGHEPFLRGAAAKYPDVQFAHATGTSMQTDTELKNFHNAFASIYEGRYIAGYAAGLKLVEMYNKDNTIAKNGVITVGYVGAFPYAEVKSGYTSWLLGVREAVSEALEGVTVNMKVTFTNSWYDETKEKNAAIALITSGCVLISQHADSWGAPTACEEKSVPNVSYNGSTESKCPNTYIVSSRINWQPYFEYIFECVKTGKSIAKDWVAGLGETLYDGSVCLAELGKKAPAEGTEAKLQAIAAKLKSGELRVFDTSKFSINNNVYDDVTTATYFPALKDVKKGEDGKLVSAKQNGVEVVKTANGITYFDESNTATNRSAPYFDIDIDGIEVVA